MAYEDESVLGPILVEAHKGEEEYLHYARELGAK
jgi:hypothetical protein